MLGVLQILYFKETYPNTFKLIQAHSLKDKHKFPLAIKLFEYTSICLTNMRNTNLFLYCNQVKDVFKAINYAYCCIVLNFIWSYIKGQCTIIDMDSLSKKMKADIQKETMYKYI